MGSVGLLGSPLRESVHRHADPPARWGHGSALGASTELSCCNQTGERPAWSGVESVRALESDEERGAVAPTPKITSRMNAETERLIDSIPDEPETPIPLPYGRSGSSSCSRWSMWNYGTHWLINTDSAHVEGFGITKDQAKAITDILNANSQDREPEP